MEAAGVSNRATGWNRVLCSETTFVVRRPSRLIICVLAALANFGTSLAQTQTSQAVAVLPSDAEIRKILEDRIDALAGKKDGIGIAVGLIGPDGPRIISSGHFDQHDPRPLDGDT